MRWLCALLICSLSACMTQYNLPGDARFVGLKLEDGPQKDSRLDLIKIREVIDVEFVTDTNYTNFSNGRIVLVYFHLCDHMDINVQGLGGFGLYRYDKRWIRVADEENDNTSGPYYYHTAFSSFAHDKEPMTKDSTIIDYDLRVLPLDICFQTMTSSGYAKIDGIWSNVVRIPKEVLIKFFAEHPRRAPPPN